MMLLIKSDSKDIYYYCNYYIILFIIMLQICDSGPQTSLKSLGYICSNSQQYIVWVKMIDLYFIPKYILYISYHKYKKT